MAILSNVVMFIHLHKSTYGSLFISLRNVQEVELLLTGLYVYNLRDMVILRILIYIDIVPSRRLVHLLFYMECLSPVSFHPIQHSRYYYLKIINSCIFFPSDS